MTKQLLDIKKQNFLRNKLQILKNEYLITNISLSEKDYKLTFSNSKNESLILDQITTIDYSTNPAQPVIIEDIKFNIKTNNQFYSIEKPYENSQILQLLKLIDNNPMFFKTLFEDFIEITIEESNYFKTEFINKTKNSNVLKYKNNYLIKFIIYKIKKSETTVFRRSGKDDRHEDSEKTYFTMTLLNNEADTNNFIEILKQQLESLTSYSSETSYYYGGDNSSSFSKTVDIDTTREILSRIKALNISQESSEDEIKEIFNEFKLKKISKTPEYPSYTGIWYHYVTASKALLYLIYCNEARKENYKNIKISNSFFWKKQCQENTSVYDYDFIYKNNKDLINTFINNYISDNYFEKLVYYHMSCTDEINSILDTEFILQNYTEYFD